MLFLLGGDVGTEGVWDGSELFMEGLGMEDISVLPIKDDDWWGLLFGGAPVT